MKCIYVEWVDSIHMEAWNPADSIENAKVEVTCGILVKETDSSVTVALSHAQSTNEYGHVISIPKVSITSLQRFNKPTVQRKKRTFGDEQENNIDQQGIVGNL